MADDEGTKAKLADSERRRAEVRRRMEEASQMQRAKKGFMTPDRKKKLRLLLRKKAAEELKKEQERKAYERRRIIEERCGEQKEVDDASEEDLAEIVTELWNRVYKLEGEKFDLEREFRIKAWEISELNSQVNDLRGKFIKPILKKVSKYENKFAKLQKKAAEFNFRNKLKVVQKKEFKLDEDKENKPEWSKQKDEKKEESDNELDADDGKSVATEGDITAESDAGALTDAESRSEGCLTENPPTPEPDTILEEPPVVEEPEPPSPAPEELWEYLKETVTHDAVISVDQLVEKLVTTVSTIPQPYLKSVVKESIKKQKSVEEDEGAAHPDGEAAATAEGDPPAEGEPGMASEVAPPAEGAGEALAEVPSTEPAAEQPPASSEENAPPSEIPPVPAADGN